MVQKVCCLVIESYLLTERHPFLKNFASPACKQSSGCGSLINYNLHLLNRIGVPKFLLLYRGSTVYTAMCKERCIKFFFANLFSRFPHVHNYIVHLNQHIILLVTAYQYTCVCVVTIMKPHSLELLADITCYNLCQPISI